MTEGAYPKRVRAHLSIDADELPELHAAVHAVLDSMRMDVYTQGVAGSDIFVGVYGSRYGEIDPEIGVSRLERDYLAAGRCPRLVYVAPGEGSRDQHLTLLLNRIQVDDLTSYRRVNTPEELASLLADDLAVLLTEAFTGETPGAMYEPSEHTKDEEAAASRLEQRRPAPKVRIPAPWHRLVGRDRDVSQVCGLLESGVRLLTLTGPGGIGKSRLAIEVAGLVQDLHPDGAWFVDLAGVRDPALLAPAVAQSLGIRESAGVSPVESLKTYLAPMNTLLLLDSFETVTAAAPLVVDLLSAAPDLQIVVTSRSLLRVRGEHECLVEPLAVPPVDSDGLGEVGPALELFLERAKAANPTRTFDERELAAAAEICRHLDGVPLAIELAAARTRLLPPTVLLGKLEHALDVLTDGPLDLPARQRTLRTTIDWDHDLLGLEDQMLFRRLSVFPCEFTLEAAEAVAGDAGLDVMDGIDSLAGNSLLRSVEPDPSGEPRFVMLQAVSDYAFERLRDSGEADDITRRQAMYVLNRVESAERAPPSESDHWLATLESEHADIRAVLNWADRNLEVEVLLRMAAALGTFWRSRCHFSEGRRWLERALSLSVGQRTELRVELLNASGFLSRARGDYDTADAQYREALSIREELGNPNEVAGSLRFIGNVAYDRGDLDEAERWWKRSLEMLEGTGDERRRMSVLNNLGIIAHYRGDNEEAIRIFDQTYAYADLLGAGEPRARALMNKASAMSFMGRLDEALEAARTAVSIYAGLDDAWDLVDALDVLAGTVGRSGRALEAGWLYGGSTSLRNALDVRRPSSEQGDYDIGVELSRRQNPDEFDEAFLDGSSAPLSAIVQRALGKVGVS